jgi:hypothetical protein
MLHVCRITDHRKQGWFHEYMWSTFCSTPGIRLYPDISNIARPDDEMRLLAKDIGGIIAPDHTYIVKQIARWRALNAKNFS